MEILRKIAMILIFAAIALPQEPIIQEIGINGNEYFDDEQILDAISAEGMDVWFKISHWLLGNAPRLNRFVLKQDVTKIRDMYRSAGFLDTDVKANVKNIEKNRVIINIFIEENSRYYIRNISIDGDDSLFYRSKKSKLQSQEGRPFNPSILNGDRRTLDIFGQNRGYPYIQVAYHADTLATDSVDISFNIEQGKFAWFGDIYYRSNTGQTDTVLLRREVTIDKGEPYSYDSILTSKENLYSTGLFDIVRIKPDSLHKKPDTIDITINVFEKKANWAGVKLGIITETSFDMQTDLTLEYGNRNLLGQARSIEGRIINRFSMITDWDNLKNRFELEYKEHWIFKKKLPLTVDLYYEPKNAALTDQYVINRYGGRMSAKYQQKKNQQHLLSISLTKANLLDVPIDSEGDTIDVQFSRDIETVERNISYAFEYDTRDNILNPNTGQTFRFTNQFAGVILGGDEHYDKAEIYWAQYHNIFKESTFAWRLNTGNLFELKEDSPVSSHNRYFLGGSNTLRGFHERSLGPKSDDGDPTGGNFYYLASLELRMPIVWIINWQVFTDAGQLIGHIEDADINRLKASTGLGISLDTPFGPIRFDYGFQMLNPEKDYNKSWHLSILYAF
ncbi:MAG: outer membrane protein assembly factor [Candidatus Zixiibacteriota bacterium]